MQAFELLASSPTAFAVVALLVGLLVGSFLNVVIHRLPQMMERQWIRECATLSGQTLEESPPFNLVVPRSRCPACSTQLRAIHNVPVVSWLLLRGRCASCRAPISPRYPIVELLTGIAGASVPWHFGWGF